jgi:hypothetical protein
MRRKAPLREELDRADRLRDARRGRRRAHLDVDDQLREEVVRGGVLAQRERGGDECFALSFARLIAEGPTDIGPGLLIVLRLHGLADIVGDSRGP